MMGIGGKDSFNVNLDWGDHPVHVPGLTDPPHYDTLTIFPDGNGNIRFSSERVNIRLPADTMNRLFEWLKSWGYI